MRIVAVVNQKGGVGKTTTCINLGAALARRGHKVLLMDLDPQAHLSISFDAIPAPGNASVYTLMRGEHELDAVVCGTRVENLWIAPTNLDLSGADSELASEIGRETILRQALERYAASADPPDVVLMDCPPSLGLLSLNALVAANHVLIPLQAEFFALQGMAQLLDVLERVKRRLNPRLEVLGLVVGLYSKSRNLSKEVLEELKGHFGDLLYPSFVRVNVRLAEAPSHSQTIFEYAPESGAAEDFLVVAAETEARLGMANLVDAVEAPAVEAEAAEAPPTEGNGRAPAPPPRAIPRSA